MNINKRHSVFQAKGHITTISTRRQEQGIELIVALGGFIGFDSWARSALVKWSVRLTGDKVSKTTR